VKQIYYTNHPINRTKVKISSAWQKPAISIERAYAGTIYKATYLDRNPWAVVIICFVALALFVLARVML
jgi:hypothetical protein